MKFVTSLPSRAFPRPRSCSTACSSTSVRIPANFESPSRGRPTRERLLERFGNHPGNIIPELLPVAAFGLGQLVQRLGAAYAGEVGIAAPVFQLAANRLGGFLRVVR